MFNLEGKFFAALSRFADLVILNILFLLCCFPVVTIGAAVTALYSVTIKMAENKEGYVFRGFFHAFQENFGSSTGIWLILFVPAAVISADLYIGNMIHEGAAQIFFKGFMLLSLLIVLMVMLYALTLPCVFENTVKNTLKNALLISLGHAPWSILMVAIVLSPILSVLYLEKFFAMELLAILLIWFSGAAYLNSLILVRIFKKYQ